MINTYNFSEILPDSSHMFDLEYIFHVLNTGDFNSNFFRVKNQNFLIFNLEKIQKFSIVGKLENDSRFDLRE